MSETPPPDDLDAARDLFDDLGLDASPSAGDDELDEVYRIARDLAEQPDPRDILERVLAIGLERTGAEGGAVFHADATTGGLTPVVSDGIDAEILDDATTYSRTVLDHARTSVVHSADTTADARFRDVESVTLNEIRSLLCVPIAYRGRSLGVVYLDNRKRATPFTRRGARLVEVLAGLAAIAMTNAEQITELSRRNRQLTDELGKREAFEGIVGRSRPMTELISQVERVAASSFPVMLLGESGTGKELVARAIHRASERRDGPFVVQNCAAIPTELLESEFFGHEKGAFTGATSARDGLFQLAHCGTLFLDEIADLDSRLQSKLLRVLEDRRVRPVGGRNEIDVDFRLVSATSVDVQDAIAEGRFRKDLYYRLNVVVVKVPTLAERAADIPILLQHFATKHAAEAGERAVTFSADAVRRLQAQAWPGNVRELEHFVKRALVMAPKDEVSANDVERFLDAPKPGGSAKLPVGDMTLQEMEDAAIKDALDLADGSQVKAAEILGLHRSAFHRRLKALRERDGGDG